MHPILVTLPTPWGKLPIYSYGVMLGTSLIIAWYIIMWLGSRKDGLDREVMANCFITTAVSAIAGARILYILTNLHEFHSFSQLFALRSGGLVAYGGFLGGLVGSWGYLKLKKVPLAPWADAVAPTLGTGLLFTRIGCYLYGCDFGKPLSATAPGWLKTLGTFPHWNLGEDAHQFVCAEAQQGSPAWVHHVKTMHLPMDAAASLPVHPTQIYESLAGLTIFGICMFVWSRRQFRGQVILVAAMAYGLWRFSIEFLRDDPERGAMFGFSTSQLISLGVVPVCLVGYIMLRKRAIERGEPAMLKEIEAAAKAAADAPAAEKSSDAPKPSSSGPKRKGKRRK